MNNIFKLILVYALFVFLTMCTLYLAGMFVTFQSPFYWRDDFHQFLRAQALIWSFASTCIYHVKNH